MLTPKEAKLINVKSFVYKGKVHIVGEVKIDIDRFEGVYKIIDGEKVCLINSKLTPSKKRLTVHQLIKEKKLRKALFNQSDKVSK